MPWQIIVIALILVTSTATILEKFTLKKEHALQYLTLLSLLIFLFSLPLLFLGKINFAIEPIFWGLIIFPAIITSLAALFFAKSLRHLDVSCVLPMINLSTVTTVIAAFIIFNERINLIQAFGITLLIIGAYTLEAGNFNNLLNPAKIFVKNFRSSAHQFLFFSIIFYSVAFILDKWLLTQVPVFTYFFIIILYSAIFYLSLTFGFYEGISDLKRGFVAGGKLILPIAILFLFQALLWFKLITLVPLALLTPTFRLHTLVSSLVGGTILKEKNLFWRIGTAVLMLLGAFLVLK
jgi:drug/metabolite transporter (DMT)-like permease